MKDFTKTMCPKCRNEDTARLFFSYKLKCQEGDPVCNGLQEEHLHFECRACGYQTPMKPADTPVT